MENSGWFRLERGRGVPMQGNPEEEGYRPTRTTKPGSWSSTGPAGEPAGPVELVVPAQAEPMVPPMASAGEESCGCGEAVQAFPGVEEAVEVSLPSTAVPAAPVIEEWTAEEQPDCPMMEVVAPAEEGGGAPVQPAPVIPPFIPETPQAGGPGTHGHSSQSRTPHSQTVGPQGPVLRQDGVLHETLEEFVTSQPLHRVVHTKGYGAFGSFYPYRSMAEYTSLCFLQEPGKKTSTVTRFSLAVSNMGTPDSSRNVRGFSTKFYTAQGPFDLLCNHIPVFLVRDAIRFPEAIRALQPSPINNLLDPAQFWDFFTRAPEATHFVTWLYSDAGTRGNLRKMGGSSVNTYVWKNAQGCRRYVKYHWVPLAGEETIDRQESVRLAGTAPDVAGRDLYDTLAAGRPVEYELRVQLMDPAEAGTLPYDPLDDTKVWDETQFPLLPVGRLTLERNPTSYAEEVEKIAFAPDNLLEGVELSDDKMLQGRSTLYWNAQRWRLGRDFRSIPVNAQAGWKPEDAVTSGAGRPVEGMLVREDIARQDDFAQAGERYRQLDPTGRAHLVENIGLDLCMAPKQTQLVVVDYFRRADEEFAQQVAAVLRDQQQK